MELDKYDRILLGALLENGRASFAQLARLVNLSAPAVAERIAKLEAAGVITGYQAKVNLAKVGLPIQCVIELRLDSHSKQRAYEELYTFPELIQCHRVTGNPCFIIRAAVDSMEHLEQLLDRVARYGVSTTSMVLSTPIERSLPLGHLNTGVRLEKSAVKTRADA